MAEGREPRGTSPKRSRQTARGWRPIGEASSPARPYATVTRRGTVLPQVPPRRRSASSRAARSPRGSRGSGGTGRVLPRRRRGRGRAAGRRGTTRPRSLRGPRGNPRSSALRSWFLLFLVDVNPNPAVLEADRKGIAGLDLRGVRDDMPVLPFRDRIAALQRREGTQDIEAAAQALEPIPLAHDLARPDRDERGEGPVQERAVRLDPPLQAPRGQSLPQCSHVIASDLERLADLPDQGVARAVDPRHELGHVRGDELRGCARRGRADIRDEVDDRHVRLMADRAHDGHPGGRDGPCQAFVVEAPQVLERSATARDDDDVDPVRDDREGATQAGGGLRSLDQRGGGGGGRDRVTAPQGRGDGGDG